MLNDSNDSVTTSMSDALALVAEVQDAIRLVDENAQLARALWLRTAPSDNLDKAYESCVDTLDSTRDYLRGQLVIARMGALL